MSMTVTVTISGAKEEIAKLRALGTNLTNFSAAMRLIGTDLKKYYASIAFASQGGVFGSPWKQLSPTYARWKAKHYPGRGLMVRTGTMQRSFTAKSASDSVFISNNSPQFKYHQSTEPRTKIPFRPMIGVNGDVRSIVKQLIQADVAAKLSRL